MVVFILLAFIVRQYRKEEVAFNQATTLFEAHNAQETIHIEAVRYESYFFGPSKIEFFINLKSVYETEIFNDGGVINEENFSFYWDGDTFNVILKGGEQKDEYIEFRFENGRIWVNGIGLVPDFNLCDE